MQNLHGQSYWSCLFALWTSYLLLSVRSCFDHMSAMQTSDMWNCENIHVVKSCKIYNNVLRKTIFNWFSNTLWSRYPLRYREPLT